MKHEAAHLLKMFTFSQNPTEHAAVIAAKERIVKE
jgi:hypothetical protein